MLTDKKKGVSLHSKSVGLVAQLDRVPDYGSGGCGFDSRPVHKRKSRNRFPFFVLISPRITAQGLGISPKNQWSIKKVKQIM